MDPSDADELVRISEQILNAIRTRDRVRLGDFLHPEFVQVNETGSRLDREVFLSAIDSGDYRIETLAFETLSVEHFDGVGAVCGIQRALVLLPDGERVEGRTAFTDVFVKGTSGWRLRIATSADLA